MNDGRNRRAIVILDQSEPMQEAEVIVVESALSVDGELSAILDAAAEYAASPEGREKLRRHDRDAFTWHEISTGAIPDDILERHGVRLERLGRADILEPDEEAW